MIVWVGLGAGMFTWASAIVNKLTALKATNKKNFIMVIFTNVVKVRETSCQILGDFETGAKKVEFSDSSLVFALYTLA